MIVQSDEVSGGECEISEQINQERQLDSACKVADKGQGTATEHDEPVDELQKLFLKISAERAQGGKATVKNQKIIF